MPSSRKKKKRQNSAALSAAARLEEALGKCVDETVRASTTRLASADTLLEAAHERQRALRSKQQQAQSRSNELKKQSHRPLEQGSPAMRSKAVTVVRGFGSQNSREKIHRCWANKQRVGPNPSSYSPVNADGLVHKSSPKFVLGARLRPPRTDPNPGPGATWG